VKVLGEQTAIAEARDFPTRNTVVCRIGGSIKSTTLGFAEP
jgi:hypothetical protein